MNPQPDAVRAKINRPDLALQLLVALDSVCFLEIGICYYLDNGFLLMFIRSLIQILIVTASQAQGQLLAPTAPLVPVLTTNLLGVALHLLHARPEATARSARGYLYGGLLIVFEGQPGPISKWRLIFMDLLILALQLLILAISYERQNMMYGKKPRPEQQDVEAEEEGRRCSRSRVEADGGPGDTEDGIEMQNLLPHSDRAASPPPAEDDIILNLSFRSLRGSLDPNAAATAQQTGPGPSGALRLRAILTRIARARAAATG